jgi:hypothetical protein
VAELLKRVRFKTLVFRRTIFRDPGSMEEADPIREGYGEGCFVVVKGNK